MEPGEALDVNFVDDGVVPGSARRLVVAPVERGLGDGGQRGERRAVALVETGVVTGGLVMAVECVIPEQFAADRFRVGIKQDLVRIEAEPCAGMPRTVHAVAVELPRLGLGQVAVPDVVGGFRQRDALRLRGRGW